MLVPDRFSANFDHVNLLITVSILEKITPVAAQSQYLFGEKVRALIRRESDRKKIVDSPNQFNQ